MTRPLIVIGVLLIVTVGLLLYIDRPVAEKIGESLEEKRGEQLDIAFLDIGQGDATFIEFPDGRQMLIDCAMDARIIEALGRVMDFYDRHIDYLVVTHPDLDHYGGCTEVLHRFEIGQIVINGDSKSGDIWDEYWFAVHDEGVEVTTLTSPSVWTIASTTIYWMYPDHDLAIDSNIPGADKETGPNNASIVMKISYEGIDTLLIGDAEYEQEQYLVDIYGDQLDADILKAGHHGSAGSSIQPFIDLVTPAHTVFSAGRDNRFGHPSLRVIRRVERAGSEVWRTDTQGDILMTISEGKIMVNGEQFYVDRQAAQATSSSSREAHSDQE